MSMPESAARTEVADLARAIAHLGDRVEVDLEQTRDEMLALARAVGHLEARVAELERTAGKVP